MNNKQKLLTVGAVGVFILTLRFTPWAKPDPQGNEWSVKGETISPEREARMRLHNDFVMMEWAGTGLIYAVAFFALRK